MKKIFLIFTLTLANVISWGQTSSDNSSEENEASITIGNQIWMDRNLEVSTFRNGDSIPQAKTSEEWKKLSEEEQRSAWCYYAFDPENGKKYGKLYNWYAVNDARGLAPKGWYVPTKSELDVLINFAGGEKFAGSNLRSKDGWINDKNGTDEFGFNLLPSGEIGSSGKFSNVGKNATLWSSTISGKRNAHNLIENDKYCYVSTFSKAWGYAIRLIKN